MPFASATRDRVMGALELPVTVYYVQRVQDMLNHAEVHGGEDAVARIEGYLTKYEELETSLNTSAASAGMIRADEVEWSLGGRTSGIKSELMRIRNKIAKSLLLDELARGNATRVVRP